MNCNNGKKPFCAAKLSYRFINTTDPEYQQEIELRFQILRKPISRPMLIEFDDDSIHLVCTDEKNAVIGCVLFHPNSQTGGRLLQMAVCTEYQRHGIGKTLVNELLNKLSSLGYKEVTCHARYNAVGFYQKIGFEVFGSQFEEVGILHSHMKKTL